MILRKKLGGLYSLFVVLRTLSDQDYGPKFALLLLIRICCQPEAQFRDFYPDFKMTHTL